VLPHPIEDREDEGGRLSGAGLRGREDVAALEDERDGGRLDGGRFVVAFLGDRAEKVGRQAEGVEGQAFSGRVAGVPRVPRAGRGRGRAGMSVARIP
jgi:hypothetical protein